MDSYMCLASRLLDKVMPLAANTIVHKANKETAHATCFFNSKE